MITKRDAHSNIAMVSIGIGDTTADNNTDEQMIEETETSKLPYEVTHSSPVVSQPSSDTAEPMDVDEEVVKEISKVNYATVLTKIP